MALPGPLLARLRQERESSQKFFVITFDRDLNLRDCTRTSLYRLSLALTIVTA